MKLRFLAVAAIFGGLWAGGVAVHAAETDFIKIGVLTDMSGRYADSTGKGSVVAAQLAAEDFGGKVLGKTIEIESADHLNKPDVGKAIAQQWYDSDGVDLIVDVPTSSVALAVQDVSRDRKKIVIFSSPGSSDITGAKCSPYSIHWTFDTYALAQVTGGAVVKSGGNSWFFVTANDEYGHALERDTAQIVKANGGKVLGNADVPLDAQDYSSVLLQARASNAKVIGLANAGADTINAVKQAAEMGIAAGGQKLAGLLVFISDIHALGLQAAQGLELTEAFYWDQTDETRAWSKRFFGRIGSEPTSAQAGVYGAVAHYLKAVQAAGSTDSAKVMDKMRAIPINDFMTKNGTLRLDGRVMRNMYLYEVKKPSESTGSWDDYKLVRTVPASEAFRPLDQGGCPLVTNGAPAR